jgi:DNA-binding CsgD family transcriptional regulator
MINEDSSPDASGILMIGGDGTVSFATPAGEAWSDLLSSAEGPRERVVAVPIWSAIAELRSGNGSAGRVVAQTQSGPIRIEASRGGDGRSVAIVISKDRILSSPSVPDDWPLTATERRVVEQVVKGASNRVIAERLFVSEKTVEWHLWHIFEKLDVASRGQLLNRYFQETLFPNLAEAHS